MKRSCIKASSLLKTKDIYLCLEIQTWKKINIFLESEISTQLICFLPTEHQQKSLWSFPASTASEHSIKVITLQKPFSIPSETKLPQDFVSKMAEF